MGAALDCAVQATKRFQAEMQEQERNHREVVATLKKDLAELSERYEVMLKELPEPSHNQGQSSHPIKACAKDVPFKCSTISRGQTPSPRALRAVLKESGSESTRQKNVVSDSQPLVAIAAEAVPNSVAKKVVADVSGT